MTAVENIAGKEEIARNEQFLLFPQCFLLNRIFVPHLSIFLTRNVYLLLNWKTPKLAYEGKGLLNLLQLYANSDHSSLKK